MGAIGRGGKGTKKFGRNKQKCAQYRGEGRRERNKKLKQERHERRLAKFASEKHQTGLTARRERNAELKDTIKRFCEQRGHEYQTSMYLDAKADMLNEK